MPFKATGRHAHLPAPISIGTRNLGRVQPVEWEWWEIGQRQSNPIVTKETFAEYQAMLPDDKNAIKNVGGYFFGALCKDGRRAKDAIEWRTVITLDLDKLDPLTFSELESGLHPFCGFEFFAHTTRGHTVEKPRLRLTLLANRRIVLEEFEPLLRILAYMIDRKMKMVDKVSWRWAQLMYWPSVSADMLDQFSFFHNEGDLIDVDAVLASWDHDWQDYAQLPRDPDETDHHERQQKAENPLEKFGWIGAFCRTFDVEEAIEEFELPYTKSDIAWAKPRYTYDHGSGLNGAVVEDDGLFLYSHHGTDPCSDRLVNAFDLVRIHKFEGLDQAVEAATPISQLPSFRAMVNLIKDDERVKGNRSSGVDPTEVFEDLSSWDDDPEPPPAASAEPVGASEPEEAPTSPPVATSAPDEPVEADEAPEAPKAASEAHKEALESDKSPSEVRMEQMNKLHAVVRMGGKTLAMSFYPDHVDFGTLSSLHEWYANNRIPAGNSTVPLSQWWSMQDGRRGYVGIVFAPGRKTHPSVYNLFQGWSVKPSAEGSCKMFLDHLFENICNRKEADYRYLLGWMAHMIQRPWEKPEVAVVLKGEKGVGKDVVAVHLGRLMKQHYVKISDMDHLTGKFNSHLEKAILVHVEEGLWAGDKRAEGPLKSLITSSKIALERKGIDVIQIESCCRVFITSNERWVVPATKGERRFAVYNVGDDHRADRPYFRAIDQQMKAGGYGALMNFLQTYDLTDFDVGNAPSTEGLTDQKLAGLKGAEAFWLEQLREGFLKSAGGFSNPDASWIDSEVYVSIGDFYDLFETWWNKRRGFGHGVLIDKEDLGKQIMLMCKSRRKVQRGPAKERFTAHLFPPLPQARREFEAYLNSKVEWPEPGEEELEDLLG